MIDWIKCSERLPEEGQTVICYRGIIVTGFYQIDECIYEESKVGWNCDWDNFEDEMFHEFPVTHWMPLPLPPMDE